MLLLLHRHIQRVDSVLQPRGEQEPPYPAVSGPIPCQTLKAISHISTRVLQQNKLKNFFFKIFGAEGRHARRQASLAALPMPFAQA